MPILDIIIQSGKYTVQPEECFIMKLLPEIVAGLISLGVAYFVFTETKREDKQKEKERLSDVRDLFYETLKNFMEGIKTQIHIIEENIDQLKLDREKSISKFRSSINAFKANPKELHDISKNDTFKFLIQNHSDKKDERIDSYSNLYTYSSFIGETMKIYMEEHAKYFSNFDNALRKTDELKSTIIEMLNGKIHEFTLVGRTIDASPLYTKISEIYDDYYHNKANGTLDATMKHFFMLVSKTSSSREYVSDNDSVKIYNLCKNAKDIYDRIILDDKRLDQENKERWIVDFKKTQDIIIKLKELEYPDKVDTKKVFSPKK